jgi:Protein of unknown function (DUF3383)
MAININRYIDIVSGVGAGVNAPTRELLGRFFTANTILPPNTYVSFTSAADVSAFFGPLSEEYLRAVFYFSWVSKTLNQPGTIQFARWVNTSIAPLIFSVASNDSILANWTSIYRRSISRVQRSGFYGRRKFSRSCHNHPNRHPHRFGHHVDFCNRDVHKRRL